MSENKTDNKSLFFRSLEDKALWVREETLNIHRIAQQTRLASSLSAVEIFVVLYYGGLLKFDPSDVLWEGRDRFIISKGHGSISLYPILADVGYFDRQELSRVCTDESLLGGIPDAIIPGYETMNGSLGHGLGVACGIAIALKRMKSDKKVFVLLGDGELYEGSVWEAAMFAGEHKLDNLIAIVDNNRICMLDYCSKILNMEPLEDKFRVQRWQVDRVDGHNVGMLHSALTRLKDDTGGRPKVLIADTVKGRGVPSLETDSLSHIKSLKPEEIDRIIAGMKS
ncbi:MAG: transketolase [Nitrospirae bacterium]|nr:transketolase [Nitrospirota bacterium]